MGVFVDKVELWHERGSVGDPGSAVEVQRLRKVVVTFVGAESALGDLLSSVHVAAVGNEELATHLQREGEANGQG